MGGLDLCYGRYDSNDHPINSNDPKLYPGIDYNNVRIKDFIEVSKFDQDLQGRDLPRMPWHDVAFRVEGKMVVDVANHFVEYWNFTVL
jgi:phospholipase D1/2